MKILLCAYACKPGEGSEAGVGWNWTSELLARGHHVTLLTSPACRASLEQAQAAQMPGLDVVVVDVPRWRGPVPRSGPKLYVYYTLWQKQAARVATAREAEAAFDIAHLITWGSIRFPCYLGAMRAPVVLGPLGGAESAPMALRAGYTLRGKIKDLLRDLSNQLLRLDPRIRRTFRQADLILLKTDDNMPYVPAADRHKARIRSEIGIGTAPTTANPRQSPRHILFAGRILYWKGIDLVARSFAQVAAQYPDARLTIAGDGPDMPVLRALIQQLGMADKVELTGWIKKGELERLYRSHGVFLFPSLHDSSGNVVLEAIGHGLPVVCLDIGGPASLLTDASSIRIPCAGVSHARVVDGLSQAMVRLIDDPDLFHRLGDGARLHAQKLSWADTVAAVYDNDVPSLLTL